MSDDDKKLPTLQNRLISAAVEIDQDDPLGITWSARLTPCAPVRGTARLVRRTSAA